MDSYRFLSISLLLNSKLLIMFTNQKAFLYHTSKKFCFKVIDKGQRILDGKWQYEMIACLLFHKTLKCLDSFIISYQHSLKTNGQLYTCCLVCLMLTAKWPYLHIKVPGCYLLFENAGE